MPPKFELLQFEFHRTIVLNAYTILIVFGENGPLSHILHTVSVVRFLGGL